MVMHTQKGFAHTVILVVIVAITVIGASSFLVLNKQKNEDVNSIVVPEVTLSTVANGSPDNAINAIDEQLVTEEKLEDESAFSDVEESEFDNSVLNEFEGLASENNL